MTQRERYHRPDRRRPWMLAYRQRMAAGLEDCRQCHRRDNLTFGHIISNADGGRMLIRNVTILCRPCNDRMASQSAPHLTSLAQEEQARPPEQRWAKLASEAAYRARQAKRDAVQP